MEWGDVITLVLVLVALWTFMPRHFRHVLRGAIVPALSAVVDMIRACKAPVVYVAYRVLLGRYPPSYYVENDDAAEELMYQEPPFSAGETNAETAETPHLNAETVAETFTLGEIEALARLVAAGKLGLTEAVKIGADAKSGERYQQRSRAIKARVEDLRDKYPQRTSDQETKRRELGLSKR
jgi:hypothetical protein